MSQCYDTKVDGHAGFTGGHACVTDLHSFVKILMKYFFSVISTDLYQNL